MIDHYAKYSVMYMCNAFGYFFVLLNNSSLMSYLPFSVTADEVGFAVLKDTST